MLELTRREQRTARKRHRCHLCGKPILPKAEYICEVQKYDGDFNTLRRHIHCDVLLDCVMPEFSIAGEYTDDEVTEILRDTCAALHERGVCEDEWYEQCEDRDCYGCFFVQEALVGDADKLLAAQVSVRENDE